MAITIGRSTLNVDYTINQITNSGSNTTITGQIPSGSVVGEVILIEVYSYSSQSNVTLTPTAGTTLFKTNSTGAGSSMPFFWYMWRIVGASEPAYVATWDKADIGDDVIIIRRVQGANTSNPIGAIGTTTTSGAILSPTTTGITSTVNSSVVMQHMIAQNGNRLTNPFLSGNYPAGSTGIIADKTRAFSAGVIYCDAFLDVPISGTVISGATWTNALSANTNVSTVMYEIVPAVSAASITNINGNNTIAINSTGNTITAVSLADATNYVLGGQSSLPVSGSGTSYTFSAPTLVDSTVCKLGTLLFVLNGTNSANKTVTVIPPTGLTQVVLSGTLNLTQYGILYLYAPTAVVGDKILFPSTCTVDAQGNIDTDLTGTQILWHIAAATDIARSLEVVTGTGGSIIPPIPNPNGNNIVSVPVPVASYNITNNVSFGTLTIGQITLKQKQTIGIVYRSDEIDAAVKAGLITIVPTLSPADTVTNLTNYIKRVGINRPNVRAVPVGTPV